MPQLHHRDPSIIGLLGASPHLTSQFSPLGTSELHTLSRSDSPTPSHTPAVGEALVEQHTPPQSPMLAAQRREEKVPKLPGGGLQRRPSESGAPFVRPFYEMIVDGIHLHPNSVRVCSLSPCNLPLCLSSAQLAYNVYPEGCILITDGELHSQ